MTFIIILTRPQFVKKKEKKKNEAKQAADFFKIKMPRLIERLSSTQNAKAQNIKPLLQFGIHLKMLK